MLYFLSGLDKPAEGVFSVLSGLDKPAEGVFSVFPSLGKLTGGAGPPVLCVIA